MVRQLGIIAEDQSDVDVVHLVLKKLAKKAFSVQKFIRHGSGKIRGKCRAWAENLCRRGCDRLVLIHDSDNKDAVELRNAIQAALRPCPIPKHVIVIAVQEVEAWLLADHAAITRALHLRRPVGKIANPEAIARPKEHLRDLVYTRSGKSMRYLNTIHNRLIAAEASLNSLRRCASFVPLETFAKEHLVGQA